VGVKSQGRKNSRSLLDLIGQIYEAALDPGLWSRFLDGFSDAVNSGAASLILHDHSTKQGHIVAATRFDPIFQHEYNEYYASVNVWKNNYASKYQAGNIINSSAICPDAVLEHSEFYTDYLRRANFYYSAGPVIYRDGPLSATLSTQRSKAKGPFDREERVFRLLAPHLERAIRMHRAMGQAAGSADALEAVALGVVLLDTSLRVSFVNERARTIFRRADGLRLEHGRVTAATWDENRRLHEILRSAARAVRGLSTAPGSYLAVSQPSGAPMLQLLITPMRVRFLLVPYAPRVLLLIGGGRQRAVSTMALSALFGLTPKEAALVAALLSGLTLSKAASRLGITYNTARWHLKAVFQKTGTNQQSALIQLVSGVVAQSSIESTPRSVRGDNCEDK
jgi:DNA-binding CsgD family transcriptional regulator/PAS domain-containing protein